MTKKFLISHFYKLLATIILFTNTPNLLIAKPVNTDMPIEHYFGSVQSKIKHNWQPANPHKTACPIVRFLILPNGQVDDLKIYRSSSNAAIDASAIKAVKMSTPFPPIKIAPYDKDGLFIEMDFALNIYENSELDIITQADNYFESGKWEEATNLLTKAIARDPQNRHLKDCLSDMYLNRARIAVGKNPHSTIVSELARKALSLNPHNNEAKELLPIRWISLNLPEFYLSLKVPETMKALDKNNIYGIRFEGNSWFTMTDDAQFHINIIKLNHPIGSGMLSPGIQEKFLNWLNDSLFKDIKIDKEAHLSISLARPYKMNNSSASESKFSMQIGETHLYGRIINCISEKFVYTFFVMRQDQDFSDTNLFFDSIKITK